MTPIGVAMMTDFFCFNDTATTEIYTLSLHDALPIMLILLGALTLTGMGGVIREAASFVGGFPRPADHVHAHGDYVHRHAQSGGGEGHGHREDNTPLARLDARLGGSELYQWLRPLAVGIVHGP